MKAKIPKGWRKLRKGAFIRKGDKHATCFGWVVSVCAGDKVGFHVWTKTLYIRRIQKSHARKK